jgi:hypothetical protein
MEPWTAFMKIVNPGNEVDVPAIEVTDANEEGASRKRKVEENSTDDVLIKKLKETDIKGNALVLPLIHFQELSSSPVVYKLALFGKDEIISQETFKGNANVNALPIIDLLVVQQRWHEKPFEVGRAFFIDVSISGNI